MLPQSEDEIKIGAQKSVANKLLSELTNYFKTEEVYLAGGMLREHYFNRPGEDFDLYLECPLQVDSSMAEMMLNSLDGFRDFTVMSSKDAGYSGYSRGAIDFVLQGKYFNRVWSSIYDATCKQNEYDVQVIFLKHFCMPPYAYLQDAFCCSLSKVWQQHQRDPMYHGDFLDTITSRVMKFDWSHHDYEINYDYIKKILNRYPEFEVDENTIGNYLRELSKESYR